MSGSSSVLSPQSSSPSHVHAKGTHLPLPQVCCLSVHSTCGNGRLVLVVVLVLVLVPVLTIDGLSVETVKKKFPILANDFKIVNVQARYF